MGSPTAPLDLTLIDLKRALKVKSNGVVWLPIYDFLLVSNSNYMSNLHRLGVDSHSKKSFINLLSLGPNFDPTPTPTLTPGRFFSKLNGFLPGSQGRLPPKMELIGWIFFDIFLTDTHADKHKVKPRHAKYAIGWGLVMVHLSIELQLQDLAHTHMYLLFIISSIQIMHQIWHKPLASRALWQFVICTWHAFIECKWALQCTYSKYSYQTMQYSQGACSWPQ